MCISCILDVHFNPHSREGSDGSESGSPASNRDFNPHSREGSDQIEKEMQVYLEISIHTPAKGATI